MTQDQTTRSEVRALIAETLLKVSGRSDVVERLMADGSGVALTSLGLDSLDALEWCMEIEEQCGVILDPAELALNNSLDKLTDFLAALLPETQPGRNDIPVAPRDRPLPLSFAQEALRRWSKKDSRTQVIGVVDKIDGPLNAAILHACLDVIVQRHEILRTSYASAGGKPVQIIHPPEPVALPVSHVAMGADPVDLIERTLFQVMGEVTDLTTLPLIRFALISRGADEHWLVQAVHHILWDAESSRLLAGEIAGLYPALLEGKAPPPAPALQYADYAVWQRREFAEDGERMREEIAWWKDHLQSVPLKMPWPFARPRRLTGVAPAEGYLEQPVDARLTERVARFGHDEGATVHVIWLSALAAVLAAEMQTPDVSLGSIITVRRRAQLKTMIGLFANSALLGFRCGSDISFRSLVAETKAQLAAVESHCDPGYEEIVLELVKQSYPVPPINMVFRAPLHSVIAEADFSNLSFVHPVPIGTRLVMPRIMCIALKEKRDGAQSCDISFDAERDDPAKIEPFMARLQDFLAAALREPDRRFGDLLRGGAENPRDASGPIGTGPARPRAATASIAVATSIPPRLARRNNGREIGGDYQKLCIQSWIDCGFRVLSVNPREEIAYLAPLYPEVEFVATDRSQSAWTGRKHPYIADLLLALQDAAEPVVGILNSDIVFENSSAWGARLPSLVPDAIVIGHRHDTTSLLKGSFQQYPWGFDWFFFDRTLASAIVPHAMPYAMGLPWWDYWLPLAAAASERSILVADRPSCVHLAHDQRWSDAALREMAAPFSRSVIDIYERLSLAMPESLAGVLPLCRTIAAADANALRGGGCDKDLVLIMERLRGSQLLKNLVRLDTGDMKAGDGAGQTRAGELTVADIFRRFEQRRSAGQAFARGMRLLREGKGTDALRELRVACNGAPEDFDILIEFGECAFQYGDMDTALTMLLQAGREQPDSARAHNDIGVVLEAMGRSGEAIGYFEKTLALAPDYPRVYINLAATLHKTNRSREALALLERARGQGSDIVKAAELRGDIERDLAFKTAGLPPAGGIAF